MAPTYILLKKQRKKGNVTTHPQPHPIPKLFHDLRVFVLQTCYLPVIVIDIQNFAVLH